jgi:glycerol-1-phosphate dehydrogenase [NAD(P)+]
LKEPKLIQLPREILMGPRVLDRVGVLCERLGLEGRALVVADERTLEIAGRRVMEKLEDRGYETDYVLISEADMATTRRVERAARRFAFVLGVGGGRPIDVAKYSSFRAGKPFISVPTAASHDGIASSRASIRGGPKPTSLPSHAPLGIVADTAVIRRAPRRLLAAGCGDVIANLTAVRDWQLAHRLRGEPYSEYAATLALVSAQLVMENARVIRKHTEESVRKVVKSLISSSVAMAIAGSSRPASGAEHLFSHALDRIAPEPALHGEQCGVGAIMMAYLHGEDWEAVREALRTVGAPVDARGLGIKPKYIVRALTIAHRIRPERYTVLGRGLSKRAAERLARATGVI